MARARNLMDWWTAEASAGLAGLAEFNRKTSVVNIHKQSLGARILAVSTSDQILEHLILCTEQKGKTIV